jgi:acyl carrier protein
MNQTFATVGDRLSFTQRAATRIALNRGANSRAFATKEEGIGMKQEDSSDASVTVLRRNIPLLGAYIAPRTQTERVLAQIWGDALVMDQVGIADSYENLGMDSMLAAGIFAEIEKALKFPVPMAWIVDAPTIEKLARRIDDRAANRVK